MFYISVLTCLLVVGLIVGKAILSIPKLYKESKNPGMDYCMDLIFAIFFRIIGILVVLGIIGWLAANSNLLTEESSNRVLEPTFVALILSGLAAYFILMITFLIAKLTNLQGQAGKSDSTLLDD